MYNYVNYTLAHTEDVSSYSSYFLILTPRRFLAEKRRQEQDIKMLLGNIHKESIHLMRAINRFKESIAVILEKESEFDY